MGMRNPKSAINEEALEVALAAVQRLPRSARWALTERLFQQLTPRPHTRIVPLQQFDAVTQKRFQELMDRNNEGQLTPVERKELNSLVEQYEEIMLANSEALARVSYPEIFDETGRLIESRLDRMVRQKAKEKRNSAPQRGSRAKKQPKR